MLTWLAMENNLLITELRNEASEPVNAWVETRALPSDIYATTAALCDDVAQVTRRTKADETVKWVSQVGVSSRIIGAEVRQEVDDNPASRRVRSTFQLQPGRSVYMAVCVSGGGKTDNARTAEALRTLCRRGEWKFLIRDGHHCLEKTAMVETLHSMMLQSVDGVLRLFPCWPQSPASFKQLRTKGAFLFSADYDGRRVTRLQVQSTLGGVCRLQNPWPGQKVEVKQGRKTVAVTSQCDVWQFETRPGATYQLRAL